MANPKPYDKTRAAKYLVMSLRNFQRLVHDKVEAGYVQQYEAGKTGQRKAIYDRATLDEWKEEKKKNLEEKLQPTSALAVAGSSNSALARAGEVPPALERLMELLLAKPGSVPAVAVEAKLLLTRKEAQALTGLSREQIAEAISSGKLKSKRIGRADRIKRVDLDHFVSQL